MKTLILPLSVVSVLTFSGCENRRQIEARDQQISQLEGRVGDLTTELEGTQRQLQSALDLS